MWILKQVYYFRSIQIRCQYQSFFSDKTVHQVCRNRRNLIWDGTKNKESVCLLSQPTYLLLSMYPAAPIQFSHLQYLSQHHGTKQELYCYTQKAEEEEKDEGAQSFEMIPLHPGNKELRNTSILSPSIESTHIVWYTYIQVWTYSCTLQSDVEVQYVASHRGGEGFLLPHNILWCHRQQMLYYEIENGTYQQYLLLLHLIRSMQQKQHVVVERRRTK